MVIFLPPTPVTGSALFSEVPLLVWIQGKPEPQQQFGRLQRIQKAAARFITCTPWQEHISPVLMQLHWLKVPQRITFKNTNTNIPGNSRQSSHLHMRTGRAAHLATWATVDKQCNYDEAATFQNSSWRSCLCHCFTKAVELFACRYQMHHHYFVIQETSQNILV